MALTTGKIRGRIEGPLAEAGLIVEDVRAVAAGRHRTLTVVVDLDADHADPVSFDSITEATRLVSELLEDDEPWGDHPYTLEVTSPGAERPLTEPRHFRRARTRKVRAEVTAVGDGDPETVEGLLTDVDDEGVVLEGVREGERIPYEDIRSATVIVSLR